MSDSISVIIPALEIDDGLVRTLDALRAQRAVNCPVEFIIVLNCAERPKSQLFRDVTVLFNLVPGAYATRNVGIRHAQGDMLAFTDSDALPRDDWLFVGRTAMQKCQMPTLIAGKVDTFSSNSRMSVWEEYDRLFHLRQEHYVREHGFAGTVNLWVPRKAIELAGPFDERLYSQGDLEFCLRAKEHGFKIAYERELVVYHPLRNRHQLLMKNRRLAGGRIALEKVTKRTGSLSSDLHEEFKYFRHRWIELRRLRWCPRAFALVALNAMILAIRICERMSVRLGKKPVSR